MAIAIGLWSFPASAFELDGHEVIEATAYKRLLALHAVPGTGPPEISGRADRAVAVDVAGRAGIALDLGRLELEAESPPLSSVSRDRWSALPITMRLGLLFD